MKKPHIWFKELTTTGKVATLSTLTALVIGTAAFAGGSSAPSQATVIPQAHPTPVQSQTTQPETKTPVVTTKTISTTEIIRYSSSTVNDTTMDAGTKVVRTAGVNGIVTHTYVVTYTDDTETSRSGPSDEVTLSPVNEVIAVGTKVQPQAVQPSEACDNGSYVNAAGNRVCSPSSSPSGATARCSDGTFSYSQSHRGTCSRHGGVAEWL